VASSLEREPIMLIIRRALLSLAVLVGGGAVARAETPDPMCPGSTLERQAALAAAAPPLWRVAQKQRGLCFIDRERTSVVTPAEQTEERD